ncbi:MAG: 2-oxoglutarate dehydrogenase, E2 component, dihydrolipoamide succinyltransferase [Bacteroidetes bacterium QS_4_64_154]|nr:MAG: 2-oxoglutarate dehydrogenase, E2 component, dihydrolipoamide succinyltransferase [Bacteroidetes bacterium QS_4_64_154]
MSQVDVEMPKMGESITEGTVIAWHKQPGDRVKQDEILLEIGTDKVDTEVPSPQEGVLTEALVEEGDTVEVGTVIAHLETEAEDAEAVSPEESPEDAEAPEAEEPDESTAPPSADSEEPEPAAAEASESRQPSGEEVEVVMPKMGESITEGTVIAWYKDIGDEVAIDETLLEIGTDKVDTEVPSPAEGVLTEKRVEEGETAEVGTVVAILASEADAGSMEAPVPEPPEEDETAERKETEIPSTSPAGDGAVRDTDEPERPPEEAIKRRGDDGRFYSPLVRSIAKEEGLRMSELESLEGSGRGGRVTKEDVLAYLEEREEEPAAPATAPERPPRPSPPAEEAPARPDYSVEEGPSEDELRQQYGDRIDYTPFFAKAAVEALREHPILNASVEGDKIVLKKDYHVGIAVAIGNKGLLAPVIRNAGDYNVVGLTRKAANMAERARNKELQPDELQGGTFTVTNIGSLGSLMGTPIINQPQVGILATGAIQKRPVVVEDEDFGDSISIRHMMYLSLSYDHRIIDGAMGASFLQRVVAELESFSEDDTLL